MGRELAEDGMAMVMWNREERTEERNTCRYAPVATGVTQEIDHPTDPMTQADAPAQSDPTGAPAPAPARGSRVVFSLSEELPMSPQQAWDRLVDWGTHGEWIPMTRVDVDPDDPNRFVAYSGVKPLVLEDRMHATSLHFDGERGEGHVDKLGPLLVGTASFTVVAGPTAGTCLVGWTEDVAVPHLPGFATGVVGWLGRQMFAVAIKRMAKRTPH